MNELKDCFKKLGFTEQPKSANEINQRYQELRNKTRSNTESDQLVSQELVKARYECIKALFWDAIKEAQNHE